jgi:FlaA1/EpsC-like NDP-sugar epimerase
MLRRFSISFAIFSMCIDMLIVLGTMVGMTTLRPYLNTISFIKEIPSTTWLPVIFYILFPILWVITFSALSIYDGKKYLRVVDELAGMTIGSIIAFISQAGILFLSYREVSRALFLSFVIASFLFCIIWRLISRIVFRLRKEQHNSSRRVLVFGETSSSQRVINKVKENGFGNGFFVSHLRFNPKTNFDMDKTIRKEVIDNRITDLVFSIPYDSFHYIKKTLPSLDDLPINIWAGMEFLDLSFAETKIEDF